MKRWNVQRIVYFSHNDEKRELEFDLEAVNIVTGASNTGKSAIIKTIDYCLGSSKCNLPVFVKDRVAVVSVKWSDGDTELLISRNVASKNIMYVTWGTSVEIPDAVEDLKGKTSLKPARVAIERLMGIGEVYQDKKDQSDKKTRISIRQVTPYMFLSKEVIDSETTLLHGLNDSRKAKNIVNSLPFFLGAIGEEEMAAEARIRQLQKAVEVEEKRQLDHDNSHDKSIQACKVLVYEAIQVGILQEDETSNDINELIILLQKVAAWQPVKLSFPDDSQMQNFIALRSEANDLLNKLKRKRKSAEQMESTVSEYGDVVQRKLQKVNVSQFFSEDHKREECPVCSSRMTSSSKVSNAIDTAFRELSSEQQSVRQHRPRFNKFLEEINEKINRQTEVVSLHNQKIKALVSESDNAKKRYDDEQRAMRVAGRVSYFLESFKKPGEYDTEKLENYLAEIGDLEERFGKSKKDEKLRMAETLISNYATEFFEELPKGEPCNTGRIQFFSKTPSVSIFDHKHHRDYHFEDIGSDENYLSLHISLIFALQRFFDETEAPVPGVVILDQVSRPYFPANDSDMDELEMSIEEQDDDTTALRKHFDMIFKEVAARKGLQVIVLEHAYFSDDKRYTDAVKYRWPKKGTEKLIPPEWEVRH